MFVDVRKRRRCGQVRGGQYAAGLGRQDHARPPGNYQGSDQGSSSRSERRMSRTESRALAWPFKGRHILTRVVAPLAVR
jgi:hypothetical protein